MTLTPSLAQALRLQLLADLERGEPNIEIDERFIKPIFGSTQQLLNWCRQWNITPEFFTRREMKRHGQPIGWVGFTKPAPDTSIIFIPADDKL